VDWKVVVAQAMAVLEAMTATNRRMAFLIEASNVQSV
jgi:hypothetical protein